MAEGTPTAAARELFKGSAFFPWALCIDIQKLGYVFASLAGESYVKLRLEHVIDDSCRNFHVDQMRLRLLCTYIGSGTEWLDGSGTVRRMSPMDVAIFKGSS